MIGQSIARMMREDGFEVIGINHLGDWGTQFGKNIVAYLKWGDEEVVKRDPVRELFHLYVKFHQEATEHPELEDEARVWFKKLEDNDPEALRLWRWFIDESIQAFKKTYALLGVEFDHYLGESFYNDKMDAVVDELRDKGLLVESEGAEVVDLSDYNMPPCIIKKSDGATIYATRDLAAAKYRHDVFGATHLIYVVGAEQTLHFQQVFKVLELMGYPWAQHCHHVAFGMMKYNGERLSTRRGKVVYLEDVLARAIAEAKAIIEEKNPQLENKDDVAKAVGVGAVVFNDLKTYRMHDVDFRFEDVLNFDGETGPYVQYTHARASSVLRKAAEQNLDIPEQLSFTSLTDDEWRLISTIAQAGESFERAVDEFDPSVIARFVLDVCHAFNRFYHETPILSAPDELRPGRLALTKATQRVIAHALYLLGLEAPTAM
jgi:arginyl-tRNA synthetase